MASESKEKKRKAIALPNDAPQKPHKKSKNSLENQKNPAISVQAAETVTKFVSETVTKSKHKPRKRAADFLSDTEDNAANGASAPAPEQREAEAAEKLKEKKSKKGADTAKDGPNTTKAIPPADSPVKIEKSKKMKKAVPPPKDPATSSSDAPPVKLSKQQQKPTASVTATGKVDTAMDILLLAPSKRSKKNKNAKGQASANAETLTADGANGVTEKVGNEMLNPMTNKDATSTSMEVEGQMTVEKELEDEWDSEDEEDDQGAALLAGFDSDGEDNTEDVGLEVDKPLPKLSKKTTQKIAKAAQKGISEGPGSVYVGRIPHGFYEQQMREYFSQFGTISKLRLSRNRRTGASKHFAFIEFESDEVAKIVANTMDNYLMFGHILKCKYAPQESLHPHLWKGANKRFKKVPYTMLEKRALEAPKTTKQWEKKNAKEQKKRQQKAEKMKELGYEMKLPTLKEPQEVLEQRKVQNAEQQRLLEAAQEVQDAPVGAIEPPNGLPKDEVALKAEEKSKKKNKPAEQQPTGSLVEAIAVSQPAKPINEISHPETEKRDKRKERKAKSKDAKAQQTQLDAQLLGDTEATIEEADVAPKPAKSTDVEAESLPDKKDSDEITSVDPPTNSSEKKRKRRKSKDPKSANAETAVPVTTHTAKAEASAEKPKKKKRKSENDAEPKGILKKPRKAA